MRQLRLSLGALEPTVSAQLDRLSGRGGEPLALAVSGGGDSLALLHMAHDWARERDRNLICFTVDHGLRAESAAEAERVAAICADLQISHSILTWEAGWPNQAAARHGRHALLAEAARCAGARHIALGHTRDDQLETFLMRARQGSTWYGLGGMDRVAPSPVWPEGYGVSLIRPLLGVRRDDLRAYLRARGISWIDEPSNQDHTFERVRVRERIARNRQLAARLERVIDRFVRLRQVQQRSLALSLALRVEARQDGTLVFDVRGLKAAAVARLLPSLLQIAAGHADPVPSDSVATLAADIASAGPDAARTLAGAWIATLPDGRVLLARDPGMVPAYGRLESGLWDGRFAPGGGRQPIAQHAMARPGLPPTGAGWRAICADRIDHLCTLWRQT